MSKACDAQPKVRLFCFQFAGATTVPFQSWEKNLPSQIQVCIVQLPGQQNRGIEKPINDLQRLADTIAEVSVPLLTLPFAFFGHGFGAVLGYEVAALLGKQANKTPQHFFVSGWRAPGLLNPQTPLNKITDDLFIDELQGHCDAESQPLLHEKDLLSRMMPELKASVKMTEDYGREHQTRLDCPITAFGGWHDALVRTDEIRAWRAHTSSAFKMHMFQGGHFFLENAREQLLGIIAEDLVKPSTLSGNAS